MALCGPNGHMPRCLKEGIVGYLGQTYFVTVEDPPFTEDPLEAFEVCFSN